MTLGSISIQSHSDRRNNHLVMMLQVSLVMMSLSSVSGFALTSSFKSQGRRFIQLTPHHLALSSTELMMSRVDDWDVVSSVAESVMVWTLDEKQLSLDEILRQDGSSPIILSCLSHFGDFNAWELTQQYTTALKPDGRLSTSNSRVVLVGIGSVASARKFAEDLDLNSLADRLTLVADPEGSVTEALGCYKGWLTADTEHRKRYPQADISPYLKLLGMIFGFGSPGTITNVLYGYMGDSSGRKGVDGRAWVVDGLLQGSSKGRFPKLTLEAFKDTPATSSLRPFELATLRLQTGFHIVLNWGSLGPKNSGDLFTRMGATFVLDSDLKCLWNYFDYGILTYVDLEEVCKVVEDTSISKGNVLPATKPDVKSSRDFEVLLDRPPGNEVTTDAYPQSLQDMASTPEGEEELPAHNDVQGDNEGTTKSNHENWEEETSNIEDSISADPAPEENLGLDDLEEAILEELHEEAVVELEAAMEKESDEDVIRVDFLFEQELDRANPETENQESVQARELFLRSLLQARLQYETRARKVSKEQSLMSSSSLVAEEVPKATSSSSLFKEQVTVISTSANSRPDMEMFQRNLLKAQYKYNHFQPSKIKSSDKGSSLQDRFVNGAPNQSAPMSQVQKVELLQRALLQARIRNESV